MPQCRHMPAGVEDDGYPKGLTPDHLDASIATLQSMARSLGAAATLVGVRGNRLPTHTSELLPALTATRPHCHLLLDLNAAQPTASRCLSWLLPNLSASRCLR